VKSQQPTRLERFFSGADGRADGRADSAGSVGALVRRGVGGGGVADDRSAARAAP